MVEPERPRIAWEDMGISSKVGQGEIGLFLFSRKIVL
jgi:hypothetical protein